MTRRNKMQFMLAVLIGMGAASAAVAQTMVEDTDGDGMYSMAELVAVYPALTEERYLEVDANADGLVDADELAAAQEAGLLAEG
ncbi:MAG: EF-hand domain-containing protein [Paracoccaceae bacterium]